MGRNSGTAEQQSKMKFAVVNILVVLVGLSYLQYASAKTLPKAGGEDAVKVVENEIKKLGKRGQRHGRERYPERGCLIGGKEEGRHWRDKNSPQLRPPQTLSKTSMA